MTNTCSTNATKSMKDFYVSIGLKDYPFNVYTAENETGYAADIFVHPLNYDSIKSSFDGNRSIVIRGNRGTGKTALLNDGNNYPMLMDVKYAAKKIVSAVERKKRIAIVDWKYSILVKFWKMIPRWLWIRIPVKTK